MRVLSVFTMVVVLAQPALGQLPLLDDPFLSNTRPPEFANGVERGKSVLQRKRPAYEPAPLTLGDGRGGILDGFLLNPSLGVGETFDSNLYRSSTAPKSDFITSLTPSASVRSDFNNHAVELVAKADIGRHLSAKREDYEDFDVAVRGRFDVSRDLFTVGGVQGQWLHEDRGSPDDKKSLSPVTYRLATGNLGGRASFGDFGLRLLADLRQYEYDESKTALGATSNRQRNRNEFDVGTRVEYEYLPNTLVFIRALANRRGYEQARDDLGFARSSRGGSLAVGSELDLGGLVKGEFYLGYARQTYEDQRLRPIGAMLYSGALLWSVTPLTSFRVTAARSLEETTLELASGRLSSRAGVSLEHELLRNLVLSLRGNAILEKYEGISRTDKVSEFGFGAVFLANRYFTMQSDVLYRTRQSNAVGSDFDATLLAARLVANF